MIGEAAQVADLFDTFQKNLGTIGFGIALTFAWSYLWPTWIRDDEGQKLAPTSLARAAFSLSLILLYITLVGAAYSLPSLFAALESPTLSAISRFLGLESFTKHIPFGVIILMGVLYSIPHIKELFERWAYFLHASQYRHDDETLLGRHLETCEFNISGEQIELNKSFVEQFDIYVTDSNSGVIRNETMDLWRKVSTLLRMLEANRTSDKPLLSERDKEEHTRIEEAHRRKTLLAMNIIRMLDQMETTGAADPKVVRIAQQLSDTSHRDREGIQKAEEVVEQITGVEIIQGTGGEIRSPVRLSSKQFAQYLAQIGGYFLKEYQMILRDASKLAAKVVVRAGDLAPERLEALKLAGFAGLGRIERHNFDGVLSTLLVTWLTVVTSFIVMSFAITRQSGTSGGMDGSLIFTIALAVAIATTIGSIWGSRRNLVKRRVIPWSSYLSAGLIAAIVNCIIHSIRFKWNPQQAVKMMLPYRPEAQSYNAWQYLSETWPFSLSLLFLVVGICVIARAASWPWSRTSMISERLTDGCFVGLVYAAGTLAALTTHYFIGTAFGESLQARLASGNYGTLLFLVSSFLIGFIIGFVVVREVRRIAHSTS